MTRFLKSLCALLVLTISAAAAAAGSTETGPLVLFEASSDTAHSVYVTDGTTAGTRAVWVSPNVSPFENILAIAQAVKLGRGAVVSRYNTPALYYVDTNGPVPLVSSLEYVLILGVDDSKAYFSAVDERGPYIGVSDGTPAGTLVLERISADPTFVPGIVRVGATLYVMHLKYGQPKICRFLPLGRPDLAIEYARASTEDAPKNLQEVNGKVAFTRQTAAHGTEIWVADPATRKISLLKEIGPGKLDGIIGGWAKLNGRLYFTAQTALYVNSFWSTDGTTGGTKPYIANETCNCDMSSATEYGGRLYFKSTSYSSAAIGAIDGLKPLITWYSPTLNGVRVAVAGHSILNNGFIYFEGTDTNKYDSKLFKMSVETGQVTLLRNINKTWIMASIGLITASDSLLDMVASGGKVFMSATDNHAPLPNVFGMSNNREPWVTDGTPAGTRKILEIFPGNIRGSWPRALVAIGDLP